MADYINLGLLIVAVVAVVVSIIQLKNHNDKENNKLLSQLNSRYLGSKEVQTVVMYLRDNESSNIVPKAYEIELFLRFFEELGLYLKTKSIKKKDVKEFFDYYFEQFEKTDKGSKGIILKEKIEHEDEEWTYLKTYRKIMGYPYHYETLKNKQLWH